MIQDCQNRPIGVTVSEWCQARKAIGKYVHTYNFERCHSALNNHPPASCYSPILLLDDHAA